MKVVDKKADSRNQGLVALMDGAYGRATRRYAKHLEAYPLDELARLEMASALAAGSTLSEATKIVERFGRQQLPPEVEARLRTVRAFVNVKSNPKNDVRAELEAATSLDPSFPLAHFSLGRHLLWLSKDWSAAKDHLRRAAALAPASQGAALGVVAAEAEQGNYGEAARLCVELLRKFPFSLRVWLASAVTLALSSPVNGRLLLALVALALFIQGLGPLLLVALTVLAIASLLTLRRVSPRLAIFPSVATVALVGVYTIRSIIQGGVYP